MAHETDDYGEGEERFGLIVVAVMLGMLAFASQPFREDIAYWWRYR